MSFKMLAKMVPNITPFEGSKIDTESLRNHVEQLFSDGVDYILLCGSTGLGPSLSNEERITALYALRDLSHKIIFQVGTLDMSKSLELARIGKELGVHAIASLPPYYFPRIRDEWVVRYFVEISKVYPTLLYNFPLATGFDLTSTLAKKIVQEGGNIIGVKETVNDISHMLAYKWDLGKNFRVYTGPETVILSAARSGLDGSVAGVGNYATELFVKLVSEPFSEEALEIQRSLSELAMIPRKYGAWSANYVITRLTRGYGVGEPRPPFFPLSKEEERKLEEDLRSLMSSPSNAKLARYFKRIQF